MQQLFMRRLLGAMDDLHGLYEWTTAGTYSFTLERQTKAMIYMVGGGGIRTLISGPYGTYTLSGGSGAGFVGGVILPAGTYSVSVGKYTSYNYGTDENVRTNTSLTHNTIGELIRTESAGTPSGTITAHYPYFAGKIFKSSNLQIQTGTVVIETDGNSAGSDTAGGASVYNGWGKGSDSTADNQTDGYFKIEW